MGLLEKIFGKPKEKCLICGRAITDEWNSSGLECFECGPYWPSPQDLHRSPCTTLAVRRRHHEMPKM